MNAKVKHPFGKFAIEEAIEAVDCLVEIKKLCADIWVTARSPQTIRQILNEDAVLRRVKVIKLVGRPCPDGVNAGDNPADRLVHHWHELVRINR